MHIQYICPETGNPLIEAPRVVLERINEVIVAGSLTTRGGYRVKEPLREILITIEGSLAYPVIRGVPVLKRSEGIALSAIFDGVPPPPTNQFSKLISEFDFWIGFRRVQGKIESNHFRECFVDHFGLDYSFFAGKRILDVGCGPHGTLEWADNAKLRIGVDPLALAYGQLGAFEQKMIYVTCEAERLPFPDEYFDVVSTFNSLDHVDDVDSVISELMRVLAPGGRLLLLTDIHDTPTVNEPICFGWDLVKRFNGLEVIAEEHLEKHLTGVYDSLGARKPFNHEDPTRRYGMLSAQLCKPSRQTFETGLDAVGRADLFHAPLTKAQLADTLGKLPPFVNYTIRRLVENLIALSKNGSSAEDARQIFGLTFVEALQHHFQFGLEKSRVNEEVARLYLEYGFIIDTLVERICQIAREEQPGAEKQAPVTELSIQTLHGIHELIEKLPYPVREQRLGDETFTAEDKDSILSIWTESRERTKRFRSIL